MSHGRSLPITVADMLGSTQADKVSRRLTEIEQLKTEIRKAEAKANYDRVSKLQSKLRKLQASS